jgi:hypothetical protein
MSEVFPMIPASGRVFGALIPLALVFLFIGALLIYLFYAPRHVRFEVSRGLLRIRGDVYGRAIPLGDLDLGAARTVDLNDGSDLRPARRTNGIGLPGYSSGWFRLANGTKALLFVTDRRCVTVIPNAQGWLLMVSVADSGRFLQALQAAR